MEFRRGPIQAIQISVPVSTSSYAGYIIIIIIIIIIIVVVITAIELSLGGSSLYTTYRQNKQ